ncbi:hypothetical protein [Pseudoalteromonas luteoviolacea]|uniref:Uncharacterized protein n=1 Tax=Pseudoalteromonas luteoviolacea S4054 TaxID=1129367 RepID=A0A0F6AAV1_9GAMM|nr:hypothetical protein [Pseudoalteromonas luteoviolacea]AOT07404.1 hypothetical protein S4054249_05900 [Pseudoalteromonas luteoviolacea]AOT12320.1 hypothetical protein S40542_05900 [Pseudoalteromonas luteoviolacea]AOT17233.1 hypothetical protein S4054_05900 [Pseudoalteromonas luteoviolacea]KKE82966.1 hypothetical protein N479_01270 [Pseudoalteromonas luteoviolacea S4054]KZN72313.1 hypothetical protein N481_15475 [Pseudoalteromonas luteoviolacea S4047-1]
MYWIKKLLHLATSSVLLLLILWISFKGALWLVSAEQLEERSEEETRSVVHWLPNDKYIAFNFSSSRTRSVRLLSNAIFEGQQVFDEPVNYAIEYQLFDNQGTLLDKHTYHHASKLVLAAQEQQVKQIIEDRKALSVASGQSFYIDVSRYPTASQIRLKLIPEEDTLRGVVVRLHAQTPTDTDDSQQIWLKLPLDWRERMLNYHTLGGNALTAWELTNAVRYDWQKLAPQGIPNIDFVSDILYETLPYNVITYDFSAQQWDLDSFYTAPNLTATFRVKSAEPLHFSANVPLSTLRLTWHDLSQQHAPFELQAVNVSDNLYKIEQVRPGLLTVQSRLPALTQWFQLDQPIAALHSYYYVLTTDTPAMYTVAGGSDVVLDIRGLDAEDSHALITLYDAQNSAFARHKINLESRISQFDRLITPETLRQAVNESEKYYLRLPKNAAKLSISSQSSVAVKLQSRRRDFHYQNVVCEQLCDNPLTNFVEIGAWFAQKATNEFIFTELQQILKVRLFEAPPLPVLKETDYASEALFDQHPISNTALVYSPANYFEPLSEPTPVHFRQLDSIHSISTVQDPTLKTPSVIALMKSLPQYIEFNATNNANDDKLIARANMANSLFINQGNNRNFIKTRLYKINRGDVLSLNYRDKHKPLSIVIKPFVYPASKNEQIPLIISTHLKGQYQAGITNEYTVAAKRYALMPSQNPAFMLHPQSTDIVSYPSITIKIGTDMQTLEKFAITAEDDMWISILEEHSAQPLTPLWWQNENT